MVQSPGAPTLLILDWLMPEMDGVEICREARQNPLLKSSYIILLTSRGSKEDIVKGLEAGADDYVTKPFDHGELRARVQVGSRVVQLQGALADRVRELEEAIASVKTFAPIRRICGASPLPLMTPFDVFLSADKNMRLRIAASVKAGSASDSKLTVSHVGLFLVVSN